METEQAETEPKEMEQAEAEKKETGMPPGNPVKKKRRISRTVIVFLFLINLLMLSSGLYVAWTTYYDNDLIEPFACSYVESDMHAREAASTFKDIADRAENVYSRSSTFFSGYVDFGYCVKLKEAYGGKIFSNLSNRTNSFSDENIADLVREKYAATSAVSEGSNVSPNDKQIYEDCYWWETVNGEVIFSSNYGKSRVEVPETLLESKKIEKIGICFSREILSEKEKNWKEYVSLIYLFLALLVLGGVFSLYFGAKLISCGRLPAFLKHCFLEVPIGLFFAGIIFLYLCYEHKISVFVSRNRMELLQTSLGSVQLTVSICVGALVLTGGFLLSFLGLFMIAAAIKDQEARNPSLVRILYDQCSEDRKGKAAFEKIKRSLKRNFLKVLKGWKIFWGLFTGNAIQGHTIADRERKRVFCFTGAVMFCLLGAASYFYLPDSIVKTGGSEYLGVFLFLLAVFMFLFLLGSFRNIMEYGKMERMIEKVYQGDYQGLNVKEAGILKHSVCYSDAVKLEQIGNGFQKAVEDQIHAERLKIELLTNVSHDLKTPLTSIISYVELLAMEPELSVEAREYVMILKKKAERLKTIISEVFELAKATSGEIQIEKKEIDFYRLTVQTLADMQDRIDASGLGIKQNLAKNNVMIYSDGERLYRVLQNLIDNALKYSLKGTRVYLDLVSDGEKLTFTIKNIAGYEMKFEAGDITERFVRGDKSRTTEGSGLGLSIAQGFTIACGGEFQVIIDGDMFKVILRFPVIEPEGK